MVRPQKPDPVVRPEDDPNSELNILRREVRQLQASVRDAALQVAAHQEDAIALRKSLVAAEAELEDSLARENTLRTQLDAQRLKKEHIEGTMAAAEALISSLREMVLEPHQPPTNPPRAFPMTTPSRATRADDLDMLLSRISDHEDALKPEEGPAEPKMVSTLDSERPPTITPPSPHRSSTPDKDIFEDRFNGDAASPILSPQLSGERQRPLDDSALLDRAFSPVLKSPVSASPRQRHSMPVSHSPHRTMAHPRPASNLILSAFGTNNVPTTAQGHAIRSTIPHSGDELPAEIVNLAKGEDALFRTTQSQSVPSVVRSAITDAHSSEIYSIASSVDGNWVATSGDDKVIKVYDKTGAVFGSISELNRSATALAFGQETHVQGVDQTVIYAGSTDGSVRTFRKQPKRKPKWAVKSVYPVHTQAVRKIILTNLKGIATGEKDIILSCSIDRTIKLSDVESGKRPYCVTTPSAVLDVDMFGGSGQGLMVSGHRDGGVRLWSTQDQGGALTAGKIHAKGVISVCCLDDGHSVVTLGRDNVMRMSDFRKGISVVRELDGLVETVSDWHRAAAHDRYVACGLGRSGDLGVWNIETGKFMRKINSQRGDANEDVLDMVARKLRRPGCIVAPHWTNLGQFVCGHRTRQVSFWDCS